MEVRRIRRRDDLKEFVNVDLRDWLRAAADCCFGGTWTAPICGGVFPIGLFPPAP